MVSPSLRNMDELPLAKPSLFCPAATHFKHFIVQSSFLVYELTFFYYICLATMKLGLRFFVSWIFSAIVMFSLFYVWHGIFLNDFKRIHFPFMWFVIFAAITYLLFGAGIYLLYESFLLRKIRSLFFRGIVCGTIAGLALFMIATIVNISVTKHLSMQYLLMDCVWQISEQIIGAMVVVVCKGFIHEPVHEQA